MRNEVSMNLLARVARSAAAPGVPVDPAAPVSIISLAAASYGARPSEDATVPTGFDPLAVALFESIVEGAYLVANADGTFARDERQFFERVVVAVCGGTVTPQQIAALVDDLGNHLREDGLARRIELLAAMVTKREHGREVVRIAALIAQASEGVSAAQGDALRKIAAACGLEQSDVNRALEDGRRGLAP